MSTDAVSNERTTVVLIHGFLDDASVWQEVVDRLPAEIDARVIDLPGHGSRAEEVGAVDLSSFVNAAIQECDRVDGRIILVGQSMGSLVAELAATERREKVDGILLITPVPLGGVHLIGEQAEVFRSLAGDADGQRAGRLAMQASLSEAGLDLLLQSGLRLSDQVVRASFDVWNDGDDAGSRQTAFGGRVGIVRGANDPFVTEELIDAAIAARFPSATVRTLAGSGHYPHLEASEALAAAIADFAGARIPAEV